MLGEHIAPQPEVIKTILLEDSPCCGVPHLDVMDQQQRHDRRDLEEEAAPTITTRP